MFALVTTHRGVVMSATVTDTTEALRTHVSNQLGHLPGSLRWTNYLSHLGVSTADGLTTHVILPVKEV